MGTEVRPEEPEEAQARMNVAAEVLELLNQSIDETDVVRQILLLLKGTTGIEAVGLRLQEGKDYPYYESNGFPQDFIRKENFLCACGENGKGIVDSEGLPVLECMCGNIIRGRFDSSLPFFSDGGSFWSNCTTDLLATTTDEDRQARTRNYCNTAGYESVALMPLTSHTGNIGLLQLNDHRKNMFTPALVGFLENLARNIGVAISRKRAEEAMHISAHRWQATFDAMPEGVFVLDVKQRIANANRAMAELAGKMPADLAGRHCWEVMHGTEEPIEGCPYVRAMETGRRESMVLSVDDKVLDVTVSPAEDAEGNVVGSVHVIRDITERKRSEKALREIKGQFRQAQKMEAVGRLAGGVAHDFNNMLSAIIGYSDLTLMSVEDGDPTRSDIENIKRCANRAASLTRQLLAFSRKQALQPRVLDPNEVVADLEKMLRRLIGEDIEFVTIPGSDVGRVKVDPAQLEQVIMNLVINARDAMPEGGRLTIETANVELDEEYARSHIESRTGPHVMVAVTDTGHGMDEKTRARIFEPFFTTKERAKGTGLGLSTVYGIVKQSGGNIWVYSEPGKGTTFKIYLPLHDGLARKAPAPKVSAAPRHGSETVLVVEDEEDVRLLVSRVLRVGGYEVIAAGSGEEALRRSEGHHGKIDILITDVVMPHMSGRELAETISAARPDAKVLYTSGYTDNTIIHHGIFDEGTHFIQKPFSVSGLLAKVQEVLASTADEVS